MSVSVAFELNMIVVSTTSFMGNGLGRGGGGKGDGTSSMTEGRVLEGAMEAPRAASLQAMERAAVDIRVNNAADNFEWIMILPHFSRDFPFDLSFMASS